MFRLSASTKASARPLLPPGEGARRADEGMAPAEPQTRWRLGRSLALLQQTEKDLLPCCGGTHARDGLRGRLRCQRSTCKTWSWPCPTEVMDKQRARLRRTARTWPRTAAAAGNPGRGVAKKAAADLREECELR